MKRILLTSCVTLMLLLTAATPLMAAGNSWWNTQYNTTEGTDFWVAFLRNAGKSKNDTDFYLRLYATSREDADVTIYYNGSGTGIWSPSKTLTFHVNASGMGGLDNTNAIPNISAYLELTTDVYKGVYVHSTAPISLYALNYFPDSYDATLVYPLEALGQEYLIQTYKSDHSATEFAMVAPYANTHVTITPRETENGTTTYPTPITRTLRKGGTYIYRGASAEIDLSGSQICSDKPIAVFQGGQDAYLPQGNANGPANHLYEQTPPTTMLGREFIVSRTANQNYDIVRVTAVVDNTVVSMNGQVMSTINQGETYEKIVNWKTYTDNAVVFSSSQPCECGLYLTSATVNKTTQIGAPTLTMLTPLELGLKDIVVGTFAFNELYDQWQYVNISVPSSAVASMMVDGVSVQSSFQQLSTPINGESWSSARIPLTAGSHVLQNDSAAFVAHVYGIATYMDEELNTSNESYAYSVGERLNAPAWFLIDGQRVDSVSICEGDPALQFTSIIQYDYSTVRWEFHRLAGTVQTSTAASGNRGDSIITKYYADVPETWSHKQHKDSVYMIVTRRGYFCDCMIEDTVKAVVQVLDTFNVDESTRLQIEQNYCYGDSFSVHYQGQNYTFVADTAQTQSFHGEPFVLKTNTPSLFEDELTTQYGCDSIVRQYRYVRLPYRTETTDSVCVSRMPFNWILSDRSGRQTKVISLTEEETAQLTRTEEGVVAPLVKEDSVMLHSIYGCDSLVILRLSVSPIYHLQDSLDACEGEQFEWEGHSPPYYDATGKTYEKISTLEAGTFSYIDKLHTSFCPDCGEGLSSGCDSVWTLTLSVQARNYQYTERTVCDIDSVHWGDTIYLGPKATMPTGGMPAVRCLTSDTTISISFPVPGQLCDNAMELVLHWCPSYEADTVVTHICETETYDYHPYDAAHPHPHDAVYNQHGEWSCVNKQVGRYVLTDTVPTLAGCAGLTHGCDSVVAHVVYVHPTWHQVVYDTICSDQPYSWQDTTITTSGHYYRNYPTQTYACDSTFDLYLTVYPAFHQSREYSICASDSLSWQRILFTGDEFANYNGSYDAAAYDSVRTGLVAGTYHVLQQFRSVYGCDSTYELTLHVLPVYRTTMERRTCQTKDGYYYEHLNNGQGGILPALHVDHFQRNDTLTSLNGCDSIITLDYYVDSVYSYTTKDTVCQVYGGKWQWIENGVVQQEVSIDRGDTTFFLGSRYQTIHGCDSTFGMELYVAPIYDIYETRTLCASDSLSWQHILYTGDEFANYNGSYDAAAYDSVRTGLAAGTYQFVVRYSTMLGCDSTYHLTLTVLPVYRTTMERRTCQTKDGYYYEHLNNGQGGILPALHVDHFLHNDTIASLNGCDSIITLDYYVDSVYSYTTKDTVCQVYGGKWQWIENGVVQQEVSINRGDTTFFLGSRYQTIHGCDSTFGMELYVAPIYDIYETRTLCASDSLSWQHILYTGDEFANYNGSYDAAAYDSVRTGLAAGTYQSVVRYPTMLGCDSTYHLTLTVLPVYRTTMERRTCQTKDGYYYEYLNNGQGGILSALHVDHFQRNDTVASLNGCDSIITLDYHVDSVYRYTRKDTVCQVYGGKWIWYEDDIAQDTISIDRGDTTFVLGTHYETIHGCDSVYGIEVYVAPIYDIYETRTLCASDSLSWQHILYTGDAFAGYGGTFDPAAYDSTRTGLAAGTYQSVVRYPTMLGCDSVYHLMLTVYPVYRVADVQSICEDERPYIWHTEDSFGKYEESIDFPEITRLLDNGITKDTLYRTKEHLLRTVNGCDSMAVLQLTIHPRYLFTQDVHVCQDTVNTQWEWLDDQGGSHGNYSIRHHGEFIIGDTLHTVNGCDSIFGIRLIVDSIYRYDSTYTVCENERIHWQGRWYAGDSASALPGDIICPVGLYQDTARYMAATSCDSTYYLQLTVYPVYRVADVQSICEDERPYIWHTEDSFGKYEESIDFPEITRLLDNGITKDTLYRTKEHLLRTVNGCDSMAVLQLTIHPRYLFTQDIHVCQDTVNTQWEWLDDQGGSHGNYSIRHHGVFPLVDSLKTINGCDSVFGIRLVVDSIYRYDSTYMICDNEAVTWQNRMYTGPKYTEDIHKEQFVRVDENLPVGTYHDFVHFTTVEGCDSDYYFTLIVSATYDTLSHLHGCQNEDFIWRQEDALGQHADTIWHQERLDTVRLFVDDALLPQSRKDTVERTFERMLTSIHGCDSLSHLRLTIHPAYFFRSDTTICATESVEYRGHRFTSQDTLYTERLTTVDGCDSIYQFHLHVKPAYLFHLYRTICDNETVYHLDNGQDIVWHPGMHYVPHEEEYIDQQFIAKEGCDSTYRYHITVHPTYHFDDTVQLCSVGSFQLHNRRSITLNNLYDVDRFVLPYDTVFADTLSTIFGCDSIYRAFATIYPQYYHLDQDTICDDGSSFWRGRDFSGSMLGDTLGAGLPAGQYVFFDSLTNMYGCDSVYEYRLLVRPTYFFRIDTTICDYQTYDFNGIIISGEAREEPYFYTDSLRSVFGCDSVYHLYLTICPTTFETRYDTICASDSYDFHGTLLRESGYYVDTLYDGPCACRHITYLYLTVEDPTKVWLQIEPTCANEDIRLSFSYQGRKPLSYSVYFDETGHSQRFEDIFTQPFLTDSLVHIPIPYGDTLPSPATHPAYLHTEAGSYEYDSSIRREYPHPGVYHIRVCLQNGVCSDDLIHVDTTFEMLFPAWIQEQHWNDAILLYNQQYNGGYAFNDYQWYENDSPLPGETDEYLYLPHYLDFGAEYSVRLHIADDPDSVYYFTCPIVPTLMPDTIVPQKEYFSVVPTLVHPGLDGVDILCNKPGQYRISSPAGIIIDSGRYDGCADGHNAMHITLPQTAGIYFFHLTSDSGAYRLIKVMREL